MICHTDRFASLNIVDFYKLMRLRIIVCHDESQLISLSVVNSYEVIRLRIMIHDTDKSTSLSVFDFYNIISVIFYYLSIYF